MQLHTVTEDEKARIRLVVESMRREAPESEAIAGLVSSGILEEAAGEFYQTVRHGLKAGITAGVTEGLSAQQYRRDQSPLWDAAFDEGRKQYSRAVRGVWFRRLGWFLVLVVILATWVLFG
jgi:hypothetical protein